MSETSIVILGSVAFISFAAIMCTLIAKTIPKKDATSAIIKGLRQPAWKVAIRAPRKPSKKP